MLKRIVIALVVLAAIGAVVVVVGALRAPQAESGPIVAIPLDTSTSQPDQPGASTAATQPAASANGATPSPQSAGLPGGSGVIYTILQDNSQVSFTINEILRGSPNTVVGTTNQVAGEVAVDMANPSAAKVGTIQVDARTLATDNDLRNRTIKNAILRTDSFEYITFTPSQLIGLPTSVDLGQSYSFEIAGDLTITGVTKQVTFDATVTPVSSTRLEGKATATITYADFRISIPQVPMVAGVDPDVRLEIDFVAEASPGG
jgi:polyisoprenoid-binding protein YceI